MKWLIISLLFINASTNLPETDAMKGFLKKAKSFNEIEKKTLKAQQFAVSKGETDFGYKHWVYTFTINNSHFEVIAIGINDSVQMMIAVSRSYDSKLKKSIYDTVVNYVNSSFGKRYLSKHNKLYRSSLSIKSFTRPSFSMFGIGCGGAGSPTASTIEMTKLVNQQNEKQLILLASSVHANDRIHGTVGLYMIKKTGFQYPNMQNI
ncbi:MAG: hypothetical protein H7178_04840 [Chitinophagaceae bacterium]|nr:hypothetical protein [Chitinophagaceae bacterium]